MCLAGGNPICRVVQFRGQCARGIRFKAGRVMFVPRPSGIQVKVIAVRGEVNGHSISRVSPAQVCVPTAKTSRVLPTAGRSRVATVNVYPWCQTDPIFAQGGLLGEFVVYSCSFGYHRLLHDGDSGEWTTGGG